MNGKDLESLIYILVMVGAWFLPLFIYFTGKTGRRESRKRLLHDEGVAFWWKNLKIIDVGTHSFSTDSDHSPLRGLPHDHPQRVEDHYMRCLDENIDRIVNSAHSDEEARRELDNLLAAAHFVNVSIVSVVDDKYDGSVDSYAFHEYTIETTIFAAPQLKAA